MVSVRRYFVAQQQYVQPVVGQALGDGQVGDLHRVLHDDVLLNLVEDILLLALDIVLGLGEVLGGDIGVGVLRLGGALLGGGHVLVGDAQEIAQQVFDDVDLLLLGQRLHTAAQHQAQRHQRGQRPLHIHRMFLHIISNAIYAYCNSRGR